MRHLNTGEIKLFDVAKDMGETKDLSKSMPKKAKELHGMLKSWRAKIKAPVPDQLNPAYDAKADAQARKAGGEKGKGKKNKKG